MRHATLAIASVGAALAAPPAYARGLGTVPLPPIREGEHVTVQGTAFRVGGRPLQFVGANVSVMHGPGARAGTEATLDAAAADGLAVVRVWALGEAPADGPEWQRLFAFRVGPDGWLEDSYEHLDRVLAAARARDVRVILVLANRWAAFGGVPQYLRWAGRPTAERDATPGELQRFFTCEPCAREYQAHALRLLERENTVTGVRYRDDPTIFAWELMNEAAAVGRAGETALLAWVERMAAFVHAHDPNHLVGAGHIGYLDRGSRRAWLRVHQLPGIDYCDSHAYPEQDDRLRRPADLERWIDDRVHLAHNVVGKPLVWGEIGVRTEVPRLRGVRRARWFDAFLAGTFRDGAAGALVWIYEPWSGQGRDFGIYPEDTGTRRTGDVRQVLRRYAARVAGATPRERNPRLAHLAPGDLEPVFPLARSMRVDGRPQVDWRVDGADYRLAIDPLRPALARFDAVGVWREGVLDHLWGAGPGHVEYRFGRPSTRPPVRLTVRARVSSELPGSGDGADPADTSTVTVTLDGRVVATLVAPVDDGVGRPVEIVVTDPAALRRLARRGAHTLRFDAADAPGAGGLCLYGGATGRYPIEDPALAAALPARVELLWSTETASTRPTSR